MTKIGMITVNQTSTYGNILQHHSLMCCKKSLDTQSRSVPTYFFDKDVDAAEDHRDKMEKDEKNWSAVRAVEIGGVGGASSLLFQKSVLDVIKAQCGKVEQVEASTCLKKLKTRCRNGNTVWV